jgi:outer membrane protein TolC
LSFRKCQGERGVVVGTAEIQKALEENKYDIIRMYYTFVYARQQEILVGNLVDQLEIYYGVSKELVNQPGSKITRFTLYGMRVSINEVKKLRVTARSGQSAALAALKEAMGVEQCFDFIPRDTELPIMGGTVTEEQVLACAIGRRPEIAMAAAGVDAFRLEVQAQNAIRFRQKVNTLAIGSDLHARFIPGPHRNGDYRPGALSPEMPTTLIGSRESRVARACEISNRQEMLYDKTRDLVVLEALNAFHNWQACTEQLRMARNRFDEGLKIAKDAKETLPTTGDYEPLIRLQALAGKDQADYVTAVYEHIKALATLERVTSGGVKPAFPDK